MAALNGHLRAESGLATEELEIELLLEALFQRYGFDFRGYDRQAVRRKLHGLMKERELSSVSMLQDRVLHEAGASHALLRAFSVQPAQMFANPAWALQLRSVIGASLRASAMPRIWLPECGGAEEAWTLAILLAEEQLIGRTEIHATVANEEILAEVRDAGIDPALLDEYQQRYADSGGQGKLADYLEARDGRLVLAQRLQARISWAQYNLVTDASFNEFDLIVCRNALLDFGPPLRGRVLWLFHDSLARFGVLCLDHPFGAGDPLAVHYQAIAQWPGSYKRK
ncbi:MAG: CheR family methyltransferase [Telluria sp.]